MHGFRLTFFNNYSCSVCLNLTLHHQLQREGSGFDLRPLIHQAGDFFSVFCRCRDHPILALHGHRPVPLGHWGVVIAAGDGCDPGDCCLWFSLGCFAHGHHHLWRTGLHRDGGSRVSGFGWWRGKKEIQEFSTWLCFSTAFFINQVVLELKDMQQSYSVLQ